MNFSILIVGVVVMFILLMIYYMVVDIRLFMDRHVFYRNCNVYLMKDIWNEIIYVIVLDEVSNDTVLVRQYSYFDVAKKIVHKSKLIDIMDIDYEF